MEPKPDATPFAPLAHGGDLAAARALFPDAPEPFIDLSTGINPHPYPSPRFPEECLARLPDAAGLQRLCQAAAHAYGLKSAQQVVAAPGTQSLLSLVAMLAPTGRAAILGPTYAEHMRVAALVGHKVVEVAGIGQLARASLAVVVNPNNPDGRILGKSKLLDVADELDRRDGILVVDEAFADVGPVDLSLADATAARRNIVVLRSFGKFFGLPGLRLGFALAGPELARRLKAWLGPWAVSGPAIHIGEIALADDAWSTAMRERLARDAQRLNAMLAGANLDIIGGTSLFWLTRSTAAAEMFERLGRAGIFVRRFAEHPTWLRWGLPGTEAAWQRLGAVLDSDRG